MVNKTRDPFQAHKGEYGNKMRELAILHPKDLNTAWSIACAFSHNMICTSKGKTRHDARMIVKEKFMMIYGKACGIPKEDTIKFIQTKSTSKKQYSKGRTLGE